MKFQFKTLYLHDDLVPTIKTDSMVSMRNHEDNFRDCRGTSIGRIVSTSKNWIEQELEAAILNASATFCNQVHEQVLALHSWAPWRKYPNLLKVRLASECLFLIFDRPMDGPRLDFTVSQIEDEWPRLINKSQPYFELLNGHITSGSPDGGCIQYTYRLKENADTASL
jgi:hypothetical protein